jgi:hypothetical protein
VLVDQPHGKSEQPWPRIAVTGHEPIARRESAHKQLAGKVFAGVPAEPANQIPRHGRPMPSENFIEQLRLPKRAGD